MNNGIPSKKITSKNKFINKNRVNYKENSILYKEEKEREKEMIPSSDSENETNSVIEKERKLICFTQNNETLKKKEVSGGTYHKLSNYLLRKQSVPVKQNEI